jgi:hypothetical protein
VIGNIQIDAEVQRRIEECARGLRCSPGEVIRMAFEEFASRHNDSQATSLEEVSVFDVLDRAGLIGCLDSTPDSSTDLSTNPIYMEDFGRDETSGR